MKTTLINRVATFVGTILLACTVFVSFGCTEAALFPDQQVPSVVGSAPSQRHAAAVERARELVRTAILAQYVPGASVAVAAGSTVVWAEGFGWRDVGTRTPVTPDTRFNIGTAAPALIDAVRSLGLTNTGADSASAWSPEAIGEEGEDFPPFTFIRHNILQPIGLAPAEYPLPDDRATFYVPTSDGDPRRGRRLMYMRDLACCANGMAFYSTPSDLVRFGLARNPGSVDGELAGGRVMSLVTDGERGIAVAITANIAYADTSSLVVRVKDAFAGQTP